MGKALPCLAWFHGRLVAVWPGAGGQACSWAAPEPVPTPDALSRAIGQWKTETGQAEGRVLLVVDHRNLLFHVQETPPARGRVLRDLLGRLIAEQRFFEGPAAWASLGLPSAGRRQRWLVALLPQSLRDDLDQACASQGFELIGLHPMAAVLAPVLQQASGNDPETLLLLARLGGSHAIVLGRSDGQLLFARSLTDGDDSAGSRLEQEINRTLQFGRQRLGVTVRRVLSLDFGSPSTIRSDSASGAPSAIDLEPLVPSAPPPDLDRLLAGIRRGAPLNLAPPRHPHLAWIEPVVATTTFILLAASATTALVAWQDHADQAVAADQAAQADDTRDQVTRSLQVRHDEDQRLRSLVDSIGEASDSPVAASFAAYLANALPPELRLTEIELARTTNGWTVRLEGLTRAEGSRYLDLAEALDQELREGDFQVQITDSPHQRTLGNEPTPFTPHPSSRDRRPPPTGERPMLVTGWFR